jgi:hypothetical protein
MQNRQPSLERKTSIVDCFYRFSQDRTIMKLEFEEKDKTGCSCFDRGARILLFVLDQLRKKGADEIDYYLRVYLDIISLCGYDMGYVFQNVLPKIFTNPLQMIPSQESLVSFTSSVFNEENSYINGNKQQINCAIPYVGASLLLFGEILVTRLVEKTVALHFLYALADYCRICPPLRRWCLIDGLPLLSMR